MPPHTNYVASEFVQKLAAPTPRLLCALIHMFDVADLKKGLHPQCMDASRVRRRCHRDQGGDMNKQMKRWLEHGSLSASGHAVATQGQANDA